MALVNRHRLLQNKQFGFGGMGDLVLRKVSTLFGLVKIAEQLEEQNLFFASFPQFKQKLVGRSLRMESEWHFFEQYRFFIPFANLLIASFLRVEKGSLHWPQ